MADKNVNQKAFVLDASAILSILLPDESHTEKAKKIIKLLDQKNVYFVAPHLLKYEVSNGLKSAVVLRKRIGKRAFNASLKEFLNLPIKYRDVDAKKVSRLAFENSLTFYDASYLQLSFDEPAQLIALDKDLKPFSIF